MESIEPLLNELVEEGLLSDARFTEAYIHYRATRGFGPIRIREELKQKGISSGIIAQYLDEKAEQWQVNLASTWQKRFGHHPPKDFEEYAVQARFLQYRGFDSVQIKRLFDKLAAS